LAPDPVSAPLGFFETFLFDKSKKICPKFLSDVSSTPEGESGAFDVPLAQPRRLVRRVKPVQPEQLETRIRVKPSDDETG
jgi:hypothetical protein